METEKLPSKKVDTEEQVCSSGADDDDHHSADADVEDEGSKPQSAGDSVPRKNKRRRQKKGTREQKAASTGTDSDGGTDDGELHNDSVAAVSPSNESAASSKSKKNTGNTPSSASNAAAVSAAAGDVGTAAAAAAAAAVPGPSTSSTSTDQTLKQLQDVLERMTFQNKPTAAKTISQAQSHDYKFWQTQPVPHLDEKISEEQVGVIEADKASDTIRPKPYSLPEGFVWDTLDLNDEFVLNELYTLLHDNYVEDDDNMFRFHYSLEFLKWALQPPGWLSEWHCGVRVVKSKKLVCFISAVPAHLRVLEKTIKMAEVNFLCVHKKLRSKRVAPVLIKEITRRVNITGIFQAVYTAGVVLPKPITTCRYWHRSLNPRKLIDVKFSHLGHNMTMARTVKLYRLPEKPQTPGFRKFDPLTDFDKALALMNDYLSKFKMAPNFTEDEFRHWFVTKESIIDSFVVEKEGGVLTDFVSYYTLPSTIVNHPQFKTLKAAYSFYNVSQATPWKDLINDALISAKNNEFDVFNALDLMDNSEFLKELKFGLGDGNLHYYLFNFRCPQLTPNQVGLVLQ